MTRRRVGNVDGTQREQFGSRLGFILISAGCAIGLGNVWRFPYITGQYGGAAFVLIYILFLVMFSLPLLVMEFSVGRASRKGIARSFDVLEPAGVQVDRPCGKLSAHDVLYRRRRMDALVCTTQRDGHLRRP